MQPETETPAAAPETIAHFTETIVDDIGTVTPIDETPAPPIDPVVAEASALLKGGGEGTALPPFADVWRDAPPAHGGTGLAIEMARQHVEARAQWEDDKKTAAASKKDHDELVETLTERIAALESERRKPKLALSGVEPMGATVRTDAGDQPAGCDYERRTGLPCAVCRGEVLPGGEVPAEAQPADAPTHPAVAEQFSLQRLSALLAGKDAHIEWQALGALEPADLRALAAYCAQDGGLPPQILAQRAHLAGGVNDEGEQRCELCAGLLSQPSERPYIFGSLVGLDCEAAAAKTPQTAGVSPDPTEPEPARVLPMRGTKNRRKKANPEAEAALQAQAAVAVPEPDEAGDDAGAE